MKKSRGGRTPKFALIRGSSGFVGAEEAWLFHGAPTNPNVPGSSDFHKWEQCEKAKAAKEYSQAGLSKRIDCEVPEAAWNKAKNICFRFVQNIEHHNSPHANNDKNDPNSFGSTQDKWTKQLERMFKEIFAMSKSESCDDFWDLYIEKNLEMPGYENRISNNLESINTLLLETLCFVERAEPGEMELPHPARLRHWAGRNLKEIAKDFDLPAKKFVRAFNIYVDTGSDNGFSEWFQSLNKTD